MKMQAQHLNLYYGTHQALFDVSLEVPENKSLHSLARQAAASRRSCARSTA